MTARSERGIAPDHGVAETPLPVQRLLVDGLEPADRASLEAILHVIAGKLAQRWTLVTGDDAELYAHTRGARRDGVRARTTALLVGEDEPEAAPGELWMPLPLRVMAVLDALQGAQDRLQYAAVEAPVVKAADPAPDEKCLASSLARLFVGTVEHSMRVRVLGHGTLYVCPVTDSYRLDFDVAQLERALETKRFVLTAIAPSSAELSCGDSTAYPLDELLWRIGLMTPRDPQVPLAAAYRLREWPDFARLPHQPGHLVACAALGASPMDAASIADATGMTPTQVDRFVHACELCRFLEPARAAVVPPSRPADAGGARALGGLFDRLWRRLVK